jgi:hypothetical protein
MSFEKAGKYFIINRIAILLQYHFNQDKYIELCYFLLFLSFKKLYISLYQGYFRLSLRIVFI